MVGGCMKLHSCKGRVFLRSYFDDDFSALVGTRAGEHFMRGNRIGQRKNTAYGYRQFLPFVQLRKLRQLVCIYVDNQIVRLHLMLLGELYIRSNDGRDDDAPGLSSPNN